MRGLSVGMAVIGGLALSALILMVCLSITGREINALAQGDWVQAIAPGFGAWVAGGISQITGDFELIEAGMPFVIFAFLPLCQLTDAHATVDVFSDRFPARLQRLLRALFEGVFAAVLIVIAWRLSIGMTQKAGYGETTMMLQFPIWWAYAASLIGAVLAAVVSVYTAAMRTLEAATGRTLLPTWEGGI
ncbi:MAG: TRAP transporter small permease [Shimia sp.]